MTLADGRAAHLIDVLHVAPGRGVRVGIVDGPFGTGTIEAVSGRSVTMLCTFDAAPPPVPAVDLLLALPRPKVMRRLWAPLASLGVGRIMLTNAERVERPYFDSHAVQEQVYRPLLVEGLQQARDTRLPRVSIHRQFKILVEDQLDTLTAPALRLAADPSATLPIGRAVAAAAPARVLLAVGPEGGWNAFELSLLRSHGFELVGLGRRTLRVDVACVALLALVDAAMQT